jgi:Flp pilus assembly protein TadD
MITLYDVLGVRPEDDAETLKDAFRDAVKTSHPDLHADDPHAIARFRQVVRANAILSDPDQRAVYDHLLEFQRWQERAKTRRGLVISTLRNLAADAITVGLLAALMGGGYLVFTHLSKTSVAAVGTTELAAVTEAASPHAEHEGTRLSREELHGLITGPGPGASVVVGATEGGAGVPTPVTESAIAQSPPTPLAKDDAMVAVAVPAAMGAISQSVPAPAVIEGTAPARETADDAPVPLVPARAPDAKVGDGKLAEAQAGKTNAGEAKAVEAKADEIKSTDPKFYLARGMASYRDGDLDRALADFDQAILLDPSSKSAYINRSIVLYRKAEIDRAFADVAQASRIQESLGAAQRSHRAAARN